MGIKLNTAKQAFPMIYAYSTPQIADHNGWTKIGYTEEQDVETRIKQQTHTSDTLAKLEWKGAAIFDDGSGESFTDKAFHAYLRKLGVANKARTEWFHIDGPTGRSRFYDFRTDRGILKALDVIPYELRAEQERPLATRLHTTISTMAVNTCGMPNHALVKRCPYTISAKGFRLGVFLS